MKDFMKDFKTDDWSGAIKVFVSLIILGVIIYSELMFLGIVSVIFPQGVMRVGAIVGAVATGASVIALYAGKSHWFHPGNQLKFAWFFTAAEVAVMILNDILAFSLHNGTVDSWLAMWYQLTPASPVLALIGWGIVLYLDPAREQRHLEMKVEAKRREMEQNYEMAAFHANMQLRQSHLSQVTARLDDVLSSDRVQRQIQEHADRMVAKVLTDVSGLNAFASSSSLPSLSQAKMVDAAQPVSLAQQAEVHLPPLSSSEPHTGPFSFPLQDRNQAPQ